tara:strand:+ start:903 stop:2207 length:1305 start_codon:yes stop_codon:yes gene_type:complete
MQHKILLLDELGDKWGKTHVYHNLKSPSEALKLLYINYPDLCKYFATAHEDGIGFTVVQAGEFLDYDELTLPLGQNDLVITPVITGSGGVGKVLAGVAMIGVVALSAGAAAGATGFLGKIGTGLKAIGTGGFAAGGAAGGFLGATASSFIGKLGVALILSGVSDMISPQPQLPDFETDFNTPLSGFTGGAGGITRGSDGSQSYAYTGAANTVGLGKTIPVVYGKALVGGHILSTNIEISNESDPLMKFIRPPSLDSVRLNGEELKGAYTEAGGLEARIYNGPITAANGSSHALTSPFSVDLRQEGEQKVLDNLSGTADGENNSVNNTPDFQILFRAAGLVDFVGNQGTTKIDGFITYRIIIKEKDSQNLVLNNQATIQGLTRPSQNFNYVAKLPYQHISGKDTYQLFVQIIDVGVHFDTAIFKIRQAGYNLKKK